MEEKKKILEMLETGKISAEEAVKLLEALKRSFRPGEFIRIMHAHPHLKKIGRHHFGLGRKKVIVKMAGDCCEDPDDIEFMAFGCCE